MSKYGHRIFSLASAALLALSCAEAHADVKVINNDNRVLFVSAGCHSAFGQVGYGGWARLLPGQEAVVYVGKEERILLSVNNEGDPNVRPIYPNLGIVTYLASGATFDAILDGGSNYTGKYRWGANYENVYFKDNNNNGYPPGFVKRRFYIVPNNVNQIFGP